MKKNNHAEINHEAQPTGESSSVSRKRRRVKVGSVAATAALVLAVLLCLVLMIQIMTIGYASVFGYSVFRVVTPSMEPEIPVNALLLSRQTEITELQEGDIICFRSRDPSMLGRVITHHIIHVYDYGGERLLETMGDANPAPDGYFVNAENLVGKVVRYTRKTNFITSVVAFMNNSIGFLACIVFPCLLIAVFVLRNGVRNIRNEMESVMKAIDEDFGETQRQTQREIEAYEITPEEYQQMYERIRRELLEELRQNALDEKTGASHRADRTTGGADRLTGRTGSSQ